MFGKYRRDGTKRTKWSKAKRKSINRMRNRAAHQARKLNRKR